MIKNAEHLDNLDNLELLKNFIKQKTVNTSFITILKDTPLYRGQGSQNLPDKSSFWSTCKKKPLDHAHHNLTPYLLSVKAASDLKLYKFDGLVDVIVGTDKLVNFYELTDSDDACRLLHRLAKSDFFQSQYKCDGLVDSFGDDDGHHNKIFLVNMSNSINQLSATKLTTAQVEE